MELKIPPPLLTLNAILLIWGVSKIESSITGILSLLLLVTGIAIALSAFVSFRKASTTVNPMKPEKTTKLVQFGVYQFSRNPMYLSLLFALSSFAVYLESYLSFGVVMLFIVYITRFQIIPEEKILEQLFPDEFEEYKSKVNRWIGKSCTF